MTVDSKRNSACLVFACLTTSYLFVNVADAVAVQASGADSSYSAEITGSAQMMRSEGPHHSKPSPAAHDKKLMHTSTATAHASSHDKKLLHTSTAHSSTHEKKMAKVAHEDPQVQRKAPQHSQPDLAAHEKKLLHTSPAHSSTAHTQEAPEKRNATHAADHAKLKIELYYESRCPDCVLFINNTLGPLWRNEELNAHIDLVMNPYGNAMTVPMSQISEGYKYWHPERAHGWDYVHICQHGGEECFGNTIQACAISKLPQEKHMELILCMESLPDWGLEKSSYECMEKFSIDKDKIKECAKGAEGNKLLGEFGHKTNQVPDRGGTPWLMINNVHLENPSNLLKAVCAHVGPGPESCKPFEHEHGHAHHEDSGSDEGDEFQVFGKMNNVDKSLVILPPPKKV